MEGTNWSSAPGEPAPAPNGSTADWRSQLQPEARQRIVNKIMDTLKRHLPICAPEGVSDLQRIATLFEEKIYSSAANQSDYLRKISVRMLSMEHKRQHNGPMNPSMPNNTVLNQNPADPGLQWSNHCRAEPCRLTAYSTRFRRRAVFMLNRIRSVTLCHFCNNNPWSQ